MCDTYACSGVVNYFLFTVPDKSQSYAFCYDTAGFLKEVSGVSGSPIHEVVDNIHG